MAAGNQSLGDRDVQRRHCGVVLDDQPHRDPGHRVLCAAPGQRPCHQLSGVGGDIGGDVLGIASSAIELQALVVDRRRHQVAARVEAAEDVVGVAAAFVTLVVQFGAQQPGDPLRRMVAIKPGGAAHPARRQLERWPALDLPYSFAAFPAALVVLTLLEERVNERIFSTKRRELFFEGNAQVKRLLQTSKRDTAVMWKRESRHRNEPSESGRSRTPR